MFFGPEGTVYTSRGCFPGPPKLGEGGSPRSLVPVWVFRREATVYARMRHGSKTMAVGLGNVRGHSSGTKVKPSLRDEEFGADVDPGAASFAKLRRARKAAPAKIKGPLGTTERPGAADGRRITLGDGQAREEQRKRVQN